MNYYLIGLVYEGIVIIITIPIVIASLLNYVKNRKAIALFLFLTFLNFFLAILFSWYSKYLSLFSKMDYVLHETVPDPLTPASWILLRISYFRITFVFISNAIFFSYYLKDKIFYSEQERRYSYGNMLYNGINIFISLFIFQKEVLVFDLIVFISVFGYMVIVYFPFMIKAFKTYKSASRSHFKKAFLSLFIMALSYILVLLCISIDRIYIFLGSFGFTIFYFLSWIFVLIGDISGYLGYLRIIKN